MLVSDSHAGRQRYVAKVRTGDGKRETADSLLVLLRRSVKMFV